MENLYLKVGDDDPNNIRPDGEVDFLPSDSERRILVQVAALNSMNTGETFDFMREFIRPSIRHADVAGMIDQYRAEIIGARNAVALYVHQKFPAFNPFKQAETINRGLSLCTKLMTKYGLYADREPKASPNWAATKEDWEVHQYEQDAAAKWVDRAMRGLSQITKTYESWSVQ